MSLSKSMKLGLLVASITTSTTNGNFLAKKEENENPKENLMADLEALINKAAEARIKVGTVGQSV